jgi:hypothetical protein
MSSDANDVMNESPVQVGRPGPASVAAGELGVVLVGDDADYVHERSTISRTIRLKDSDSC